MTLKLGVHKCICSNVTGGETDSQFSQSATNDYVKIAEHAIAGRLFSGALMFALITIPVMKGLQIIPRAMETRGYAIKRCRFLLPFWTNTIRTTGFWRYFRVV